MYDHHVFIKQVLPGKAFTTSLAEELVLSSMILHVTIKVVFSCKCLGAVKANMLRGINLQRETKGYMSMYSYEIIVSGHQYTKHPTISSILHPY